MKNEVIKYLHSIGFKRTTYSSLWQKNESTVEVGCKAIRFYSKNGVLLERFRIENESSMNALFFVYNGLDK